MAKKNPKLNNVRRVAAAMDWNMPMFIDPSTSKDGGYLTWKNRDENDVAMIKQKTGIEVKVVKSQGQFGSRLWVPTSDDDYVWVDATLWEKEEARNWLLNNCEVELRHNDAVETLKKIIQSDLHQSEKDILIMVLNDLTSANFDAISNVGNALSSTAQDWIKSNIVQGEDVLSINTKVQRLKSDLRKEVSEELKSQGVDIHTYGKYIIPSSGRKKSIWNVDFQEIIIKSDSKQDLITFKGECFVETLRIEEGVTNISIKGDLSIIDAYIPNSLEYLVRASHLFLNETRAEAVKDKRLLARVKGWMAITWTGTEYSWTWLGGGTEDALRRSFSCTDGNLTANDMKDLFNNCLKEYSSYFDKEMRDYVWSMSSKRFT